MLGRIFGRYAVVLGTPGVPAAAGAATLSGIAQNGALPLTLVVFIEDRTGSFGAAGGVIAAMTAAAAVTSPVRGRLVDRLGQTRVIGLLVLLGHAALAALVAAVLGDAHVAALIALGAVAGAASAPLFPALRALWATLVPPEQRDTAYALQSVLIEVMYLGGPLLAALVVALTSPTVAIVAVLITSAAGGVAFLATSASRSWRPEDRDAPARLLGALASPGMRTVLLAQVPYGAVIGAFDVAAPAFADEHGNAASGGLALAALAAGSLAGGIAYGARDWPGDRPTRLLVLSGLLALPLLPLALAPSLVVVAALAALAGAAIAPQSATVFGLLDDTAPRGTATEAATWLVTAYAGGAAIGAAVAGAATDSGGARAALLVVTIGALLAVVPVAARQRTLLPRTSET